MIPLKEIYDALPQERRERIERRAAELIAEEMTMRGLRKARKITESKLARKLGIDREQVACSEQRADLHIATLRRSIEALGGRLTLVAEFPDGAPVAIAGFSTIADSGPREDESRPARKRRPAKQTETPGTTPVHSGPSIALQS